MAMCPVCNSLKVVEIDCPNCSTLLKNDGKVADFMDPYSHYEDEETVKMGDGYSNTAKDQICPHLMVCQNCGYDKVIFIQEV
ncbi:hypothetical protein [Rummeliibacillus pycnus]|uniref:hypothetical protein n=1 Tax=Rummeliibacillus pycnus TaxID=101070 RepID=UPI000C9ADFFC|nr:hypothetical protein [Rummeliibacillus pycnus]